MAGVRKRTAADVSELPVEHADTQQTTTAKSSAEGAFEIAEKKPQATSEAPKKSTAGRKRVATAEKTAPTASADQPAAPKGAAKKSGAGGTAKQAEAAATAKKTAQAKSDKSATAGKGTAAKAQGTAAAGTKSTPKKSAAGTAATAKKAATGTKSAANKTSRGAKAASKSAQAANEIPPQVTEQQTDVLPALPLIDAHALVDATPREVGEAHPPVGFPGEMVKRHFFARLGVLLLLAAVLTASVFIYLYRPTSYVERTNTVNFLYAAGENKTTVVVNGVVRGALDGALQSATHNARGDIHAAVVGDRLYLIRGKNIIPVAQGVLDYQLAAGGHALAYRTAENQLYYRQTGKRDDALLISKACVSAAYCLSADGRELVYTYQREGDAAPLLQIESFTDSKPYIESVAGLVPVAVSNKCQYIYFTDESGALFIYNRKQEKRIKCADAPDKGSLTFNRDCTELLFTEGGATVLFIKGERRQIAGVAAQDSLTLLPNHRVAALPCENGMQYMTASFLNAYYLHLVGTGKQLARLDRRARLTDISFVDDASDITVTDKGVFFLLTDKSSTDTHTVLYRVKPRRQDKELVAWDVLSYQANVDGSRVLYVGHQDALYAWSAAQDTKRLCDSVLPDSLTVTADDVFCFYRTDGVLAFSDNGRAVRDIATGVQGFLVDAHAVFYIVTSPESDSTTLYINYRNARLGESLGDGYTDFH